jgi:tetratricopeptide (TPR) repeat protein
MDLPNYLPRVARTLGAAHTLCGCIDDAVPLLEQGVKQAMALERVDLQAFCGLSLGEAQLLAGHLAKAHGHAQQALAHTREHQERDNQVYALRLLDEVAAHHTSPDIDETEAHYREALALAEKLGMRPLQAHCHLGLGILYVKAAQQV